MHGRRINKSCLRSSVLTKRENINYLIQLKLIIIHIYRLLNPKANKFTFKYEPDARTLVRIPLTLRVYDSTPNGDKESSGGRLES